MMKKQHPMLVVAILSITLSACNRPIEERAVESTPSGRSMLNCPDQVQRTISITGVKVRITPKNERGLIDEPLVFDIEPTYRWISNNAMSSPEKPWSYALLDLFFPPAMALSCANPTTILNPVLSHKTTVTLNRSISYKGKEIPAGSNILKYEKSSGGIFNIFIPDLSPPGVHTATIGKVFKFPKGQHTALFSWTLKTGEKVSDHVEFTVK